MSSLTFLPFHGDSFSSFLASENGVTVCADLVALDSFALADLRLGREGPRVLDHLAVQEADDTG